MRMSDWSSDVCSSDLAKKLAAAGRDHRPLPAHSGRASSAGRLSATSTINWPNSAFAHANQLRVKFFGSSLWKLSCMKPVPPCVVLSQRRHWRIVASSSAFIARVMIDIGQIMRSEEHTSELQSLMRISYAVFCLKKQKNSDSARMTSHSTLT